MYWDYFCGLNYVLSWRMFHVHLWRMDILLSGPPSFCRSAGELLRLCLRLHLLPAWNPKISQSCKNRSSVQAFSKNASGPGHLCCSPDYLVHKVALQSIYSCPPLPKNLPPSQAFGSVCCLPVDPLSQASASSVCLHMLLPFLWCHSPAVRFCSIPPFTSVIFLNIPHLLWCLPLDDKWF